MTNERTFILRLPNLRENWVDDNCQDRCANYESKWRRSPWGWDILPCGVALLSCDDSTSTARAVHGRVAIVATLFEILASLTSAYSNIGKSNAASDANGESWHKSDLSGPLNKSYRILGNSTGPEIPLLLHTIIRERHGSG